MKVENMLSAKGNTIANQFIIIDDNGGMYFQSYSSIIVFIDSNKGITLDSEYWDYSVTTSKYRNIFLEEDKKTTQRKIDSGEYKLDNLNTDRV